MVIKSFVCAGRTGIKYFGVYGDDEVRLIRRCDYCPFNINNLIRVLFSLKVIFN